MPRRIVVSYIVPGVLDDDAGFLSVVLIAPFDPADVLLVRVKSKELRSKLRMEKRLRSVRASAELTMHVSAQAPLSLLGTFFFGRDLRA